MPVSKKRKKEGRPVQRKAPAAGGEEQAAHPEAEKPEPLRGRGGRPTNPFVQQQQGRRGAQRGR